MGYAQDCANSANDIKEHMAREDARRQNELLMLQKQMEDNRIRLNELREHESQRSEAMEKLHEENMQKISEKNRAAYEKNMERQDAKLEKLSDKEMAAIEKHNDILEKQKELLSQKLVDLSERQQKNLLEKEEKIKEKEAEAANKVADLKKEKNDIQSKLDDDLQKYQKEYLETQERHSKEQNELLEENHKVLMERESDEQTHQNRLVAQEKGFLLHREMVTIAGMSDETERDFFNAVTIARQAGNEAVREMVTLGTPACRLKVGKTAKRTDIRQLKDAIQARINPKLSILHAATQQILEEQENKNEKVIACQKAAREIDKAIDLLEAALSNFNGSLDEDPIETSPEKYRDVVEKNGDLREAVSDLPAVTISHHTIQVITSDTTTIANEAQARIKGTGNRSIQN